MTTGATAAGIPSWPNTAGKSQGGPDAPRVHVVQPLRREGGVDPARPFSGDECDVRSDGGLTVAEEDELAEAVRLIEAHPQSRPLSSYQD